MKKFFLLISLVILTTLTGCSVIGGIFKAGVWVGVLAVVLVVAVIIYYLTRGSGKK